MKNLLSAIADVMKEVGYVRKSGTNAFHKYRYASEADLLAVLRPAMVTNGLILIPRVTSVSGPDDHGITHVTIAYDLAHRSGEIMPNAVIMAGQGGDKNSRGVGDKGVYKAITGANKYALFKLFQIETGDDPEGAEAPNETHHKTDPADGHEYEDDPI